MSEDGYRNMQDETKSKAIKATIIVVFVVFVVWFLWPTDQWLGFVYPNSSSLSNYNEIGPFDSLESCQTNAQIVLVSCHKLNVGYRRSSLTRASFAVNCQLTVASN